jgi:hypothetical protein
MHPVSDNSFLEETPSPAPAAIAAALGERQSLYDGILEAAKGFEREWKHYGRKYGWKLKVHDGRKALLELTIAPDEIRLSLAVRESEMGELRGAPGVAPILELLLPPGKSKEGWGIRLSVVDAESLRQARALVAALAAIRLKG